MNMYKQVVILPKVQEMLRIRSLHRQLRAKGFVGVDCYRGKMRLLMIETAIARATMRALCA